jgi:hypothetical protein
MLSVLLESAVRSILLGFAVWTLLKLARLRDTATETAIWTVVLIAALSMPLLSHTVPGFVLRFPHWSTGSPVGVTALELLGEPGALQSHVGATIWPAFEWHAYHGPAFLMAAYLTGLAVCALRLAMGLLLSVRLYCRSTPVRAAWVQGRRIRVAAELSGPVSLAGTILLPADHGEWSAAKRSAVLAHEEAHIARGDFYVQLAALFHCALFWFSPFAWWLQTKLAEIAETASDEAAIRRLDDPATYAEILVDISRRAQKSSLLVAMAKSSFIEQRIDHILSEAPARCLSSAQRLLSVALLAVLAIAVAGAQTTVDALAHEPSRKVASVAHGAAAAPRKTAVDSTSSRGARVAHAAHARDDSSHAHDQAASVAQQRDAPTYDPRALLKPVYTPKPNTIPAETSVHAGREFYIRSSERPVADVSVTYALDGQGH